MIESISVVQIINRYFDDVFGMKVLLDESFARILFFVLINVVDLLDACLFDYFGTRKAWEVGCIESTALGLANSDLDKSRFLCMKA